MLQIAYIVFPQISNNINNNYSSIKMNESNLNKYFSLSSLSRNTGL